MTTATVEPMDDGTNKVIIPGYDGKDIPLPEDLKQQYSCDTLVNCSVIRPEQLQTISDIMRDRFPDKMEEITATMQDIEELDMFLEPAGASAPSESAWVIVLIIFLQTAIFLLSMFGVYKMWKDIIHFITNSSDSKIRYFLKAIGGGEVSYSKTKVMGTGIGITILILAVTVLAMFVIGNVRIY